MTDKESRLYPFEELKPVAYQVLNLMIPFCRHIEIAGSIRRFKDYCHDIDVVMQVYRPQDLRYILGQCSDVTELDATNPLLFLNRKIVRFNYKMYPIDCYIANEDGSNFGALLQMRTGPASFNIRLAQRAKKGGVVFKAGHGIFTPNGERIDQPSFFEYEVFKALQMDYIEPQQRK